MACLYYYVNEKLYANIMGKQTLIILIISCFTMLSCCKRKGVQTLWQLISKRKPKRMMAPANTLQTDLLWLKCWKILVMISFYQDMKR